MLYDAHTRFTYLVVYTVLARYSECIYTCIWYPCRNKFLLISLLSFAANTRRTKNNLRTHISLLKFRLNVISQVVYVLINNDYIIVQILKYGIIRRNGEVLQAIETARFSLELVYKLVSKTFRKFSV